MGGVLGFSSLFGLDRGVVVFTLFFRSVVVILVSVRIESF